MLQNGRLHQCFGRLLLCGAAERPAQALAHDLVAKGMEGADFHAVHAAALQPVLHLIPGFLVERQRQDALCGNPLVEQVQDAVHQGLGLARSRRSQHADRPADGHHRSLLAGVQVVVDRIGGQGLVMDSFLNPVDAFLRIGFDLRCRKPADRIACQ